MKKIFKIFLINIILFPILFLSTFALSSSQTIVYAADKTVSEKLSDFVLPIFGGETNNTTDNKGEVANFAGELTNNLVRNGIELVDVVQEVGSDLIFKPTRSFWDIAKDTYESVTNARWEYVANGAFVVNVPNLSSQVRGTSPTTNKVRFSSYDLVNESSFSNWNISFSFNLSSSEKYRVSINDMEISNMDSYIGTTYGRKRHIINSVSENEISYTQYTGYNIDISFASFVNDSQYADTVNLGVLRGSRNAESEQVTRAYPSGNINDNNRPDINNNIDNHINNFFPGSLSDDDIKVYNLNTTYIENTFVNGGSVNYEILNNTEEVIQETDSDFPIPEDPADLDNSGGFDWGALFDLIGTVISAISNLGTSIVSGISDLLSTLLDNLVKLIVPENLDLSGRFSDITDKFTQKFQFVFDISDSFSSVLGSPKKIQDININIMDHEVVIFSKHLIPALRLLRGIVTGFFCIMTLVHIYRRIVGKGDILE